MAQSHILHHDEIKPHCQLVASEMEHEWVVARKVITPRGVIKNPTGGFGDAEIKFWLGGPSSWPSVLAFLISSCAAAHRVLCRFCPHRSLAGLRPCCTVELCGQKTFANSSVHTDFMCFLPRALHPRKGRWVGREWQQGQVAQREAWVMDASGTFLQLTPSKCQEHKNGMGMWWESQRGLRNQNFALQQKLMGKRQAVEWKRGFTRHQGVRVAHACPGCCGLYMCDLAAEDAPWGRTPTCEC